MAFNPFHSFRKHQKVCVRRADHCLHVRLYSTGSAARPIRHQLLVYSHGDTAGRKVVTLYGRDLYTNDLTAISKSRQLANEFMFAALNAAQTEASKDLQDYKPEKPDAADETFQRLSRRTERLFQARSPEEADAKSPAAPHRTRRAAASVGAGGQRPPQSGH